MASSTRLKDGAVRVEGLNELIARLRAMENGAEKNIRIANKGVASKVATDAAGMAASLGGVAAHVAPSIKASAGVKSGSVAFGGGDYPMGAGAEFGGQGRPTTMQFQPHRGTQGYFVYPTIRDGSESRHAMYRLALERVIREAGLQ